MQSMRKDMGMSLDQIAQGQGVSEALVRRVLKVDYVKALPRLRSRTAGIKGVRSRKG